MIKFKYLTFSSSEEFEKWQDEMFIKFPGQVTITQLSPILIEMTGATKTNKVEKGTENCNISIGVVPYGIFVVYYFK